MSLPRLASFTALLVTVILAASGLASAQATMTLEVKDLSPGMTVPVGGEPHKMNVKVVLTGNNFVCTTNTVFKVNIVIENQAPDVGFNATATPAVLDFAVSQGAHAEPPLSKYSNEMATEFAVQLGKNVPKGHGPHQMNFVAAWDGTKPADCQASSWPSKDSVKASVPHEVTPQFPAPPTGSGTGGPNETGGENGGNGGGSNESPVPAPSLFVALTALVLIALRRRA